MIKVVPGSGRHGWKLDKAGTLVCYLKSRAEKGLANKELIRLLSKELSVPQADIQIVTGHTSRLKKINIAASEVTRGLLLKKLGLDAAKNSIDTRSAQISIFDTADK